MSIPSTTGPLSLATALRNLLDAMETPSTRKATDAWIAAQEALTGNSRFAVECLVTPRAIADMMVTAFEGGASGWCASARIVGDRAVSDPKQLWYDDERFWTSPFTLLLTDAESDDTWIFTSAMLAERLRTMPPHLLAKLICASRDPECGDEGILDGDEASDALQWLVFGVIVFG